MRVLKINLYAHTYRACLHVAFEQLGTVECTRKMFFSQCHRWHRGKILSHPNRSQTYDPWAPVIQTLDSAIHWINIWETHWVIHRIEIYPVDYYPPFFNFRGKVTSPGVLPLSFRRLVGAQVTKLGSCHLSQKSSCQFL